MDLIAQLNDFEGQALAAIESAADSNGLEAVRIQFLGAKQGKLRDLQGLLGQATKEQKPLLGKRFNEVKNRVAAELEARQRTLTRPKLAAGGLDVTLPGVMPRLGRRHPLTQTILDFKDIMGRFGFTAADGPEIEDEYHNFEALNIPADHPARDPLDNFYLASGIVGAGLKGEFAAGDKSAGQGAFVTGQGGPRLLRSQTSTVQIRVMERTKPPVRIISVGRVYRPDTIDATHSCMFHQMEGLMVGEAVTMAELKTVLRLFARAYLGHDVHIRFRPSFFPFTEPSVEVDMSWNEPGKPWLEIGGAGMVDPNVLSAVGYNPDEVSGFAFGLGVERFCMRRHNIPDIRLFTNNDVRFLSQF
jgi:phenylalanyl-tRNA synthetase alpha chain